MICLDLSGGMNVKKSLMVTLFFGLLIQVSSCSLVENTRRSLLGGPAKSAGSPSASDTVPREQYETLLAQYNELKSKSSTVTVAESEESMDASPTVPLAMPMAPDSDAVISMPLDDFEELRKGILAYELQKYDLAMNIFDKLTSSAEDQVKYRARFYAGKILFARGEFSLAMQVFEDLLERFAFSGLSVESLQLARDCASKLGQTEKQKKLDELAKRLGLG
jgi:tetratricopeptide (TPR) repeat protein